MRIREAAPADENKILELLRQYCVEVSTPWSDEHLLAGLRPLLLDSSKGVVLVAEDEEIFGYCVLTWGWGIESGGQEALVDEMYIVQSKRGLGHGEELLRAAVERAKLQGVRVIFLETERENPKSRELYQRVGFEEETSVWMSIKL